MGISETEYQQLLRNGQGRIAPKPSKYKAVKVTVDGHTFDSKKEAARYAELKLLEKAGAIDALVLQPSYALEVNGETIGYYFGDFKYGEPVPGKPGVWHNVIEDVKGVRTPLYRWKKKHFEAQYGIQIRET